MRLKNKEQYEKAKNAAQRKQHGIEAFRVAEMWAQNLEGSNLPLSQEAIDKALNPINTSGLAVMMAREIIKAHWVNGKAFAKALKN